MIVNRKTLTAPQSAHLAWMLAHRAVHSVPGRTQHWTITARSRRGLVLWTGNIRDEVDAWRFWSRLTGGRIGWQDYAVPQPAYCPSLRDVPGLAYEFATVVSFTAVGTTSQTFTSPVRAGYLVIGGGSGGNAGTMAVVYGYGGASGVTRTGTVLRQRGSYTVTVGGGGSGAGVATSGAGGNSAFDAITATGGHAVSNAGGGTGGANDDYAGGGLAGGYASGGGAGSAAAGSYYNGGNGTTSSISGSSVTYGGGGAGMTGTGASGIPGTGGGGAAGAPDSSTPGQAGATNTGSGGGGCASQTTGGAGGSGIVILSYTPISILTFNMPMLGM